MLSPIFLSFGEGSHNCDDRLILSFHKTLRLRSVDGPVCFNCADRGDHGFEYLRFELHSLVSVDDSRKSVVGYPTIHDRFYGCLRIRFLDGVGHAEFREVVDHHHDVFVSFVVFDHFQEVHL